MSWTQVIDPLQNISLSALIASIPIIFIFLSLLKKMKGYQTSLITLLIAIIIAMTVYGMPLKLALLSTLHGAFYGLFPICWIIISAVFLFNVTVKSGQFEIIKNFMASITPDRRLQALLIAFSFGAFLEGAAGFGAPVAISGAMLVGLGFNPLYAAGICLIANTAPVAFGSVGTPIIMASRMSDIPELAISQMVGRTLPLLSLILPLYLVVLMSGFKRSMEVLPAIIVSGVSFALVQWVTSNFMGPMLPDVLAGITSIICLMILLKYWKPDSIWRFSEEPLASMDTRLKYTKSEVLRAWSPFIIMTLFIIAWGLQPVKDALNHIGFIKFQIPGLNGSILKPDGSPLGIKAFEFNFLSAPGSAVTLATLISLPLLGLTFKRGIEAFVATLKQLKVPIITIASVVGFAFITNYSGMSITIAMALASTGVLFPFFSPILGWLGVFLTGSDTSSNALFSKLQSSSADALGFDPVITVSANASGGVTGKMISPQSIAIGAAAVGLVGKEADLFRFTFKHSFLMLFIICVLTCLQVYVMNWIVPVYKKLEVGAPVAAGSAHVNLGYFYLGILTIILLMISSVVLFLNKQKIRR
ncbi:MAG: lactate permease LctP family transporter [Saprospiraceae bacterium]